MGIVAILVPAAYRVWYALAMHHRNILFTIGIAIVSAIALFPLTGVRRLSRRGKRYVDGLRASLTGGGSRAALESPAFAVMVAAGEVDDAGSDAVRRSEPNLPSTRDPQ